MISCKSIRVLALVTCSVAPGALYANDPVTRVSNDPHNAYTVLDFDSRSFVLDAATGTVIITGGDGSIFEIPLVSAAHEFADGDIALRDSIVSSLTDFATNPGLIFTQTGSTVPRLAYSEPPNQGPGTFQPQRRNTKEYEIMAPSGLGGPCDLSPCSPYMRSNDGRIYYMYDMHSTSIGQGSVEEQQEFVNEFEKWKEQQRKEACDEAHFAAASAAIAGTAVAKTCPLSMTPQGALGCAGSTIGYFVAMKILAQKSKQCAAGYSGGGTE